MAMTTMAEDERVEVDPVRLAQVLDLYGRGLCRQAYRVAQAIGPLKGWAGPAARVAAGRLAANLGAPRLASWLHTRAYREAPDHPEATYYFARRVLERRGPLAAWQFLRRHGELEAAAPDIRADWLAFHGCVLGLLRDFDAAERRLERAEQLAPDRAWIHLERAYLLEREDRYDAALDACQRALELRPWYRPGVQAAAHALQQLDRDGEALDLLTEAAGRLESGPVAVQLAAQLTELGRHAEARAQFERFAALSPLLEKDLAEWLDARRADAAYYLGDLRAAAEFARQANDPFYTKLAERLAAATEPGRRVLLDVGFVRQRFQTCAPATLAAVARYWRRPIDQDAVAAAICYDGTPDHRERSWAESNGWAVREFTVTWEAAVALLDRGIPFTLTTVEPTNAHLQAVIGYDALRGSLLIRDPSLRHFGEGIVGPLLRRYRATGPRGMAMVPADRAELLAGLGLPDAALYDHFYALQRALEAHDRDRAAAACAAIGAAAPGHRLALQARRALALYDADRVALLGCVEELLALYPDDGLWQLMKLVSMRDLAPREERLAFLRSICDRPGSDPVFLRQYAQELSADAREHDRALFLLRRALRRRPADDVTYAVLAGILAARREFAGWLELSRFAASLDDKDEQHARNYFEAARALGRTDEAMEFLRARTARFGARSSGPARTLFEAYSQGERTAEAFAVLDEALALRPDDGELKLFAAEAHGARGRFDRAAELLAAAEGHTARGSWLRAAARLAQCRGDLPAALGLWRQIVAAEPLAADANRALAQLLAETAGREAALEHLGAACARFPHNLALLQAWNDWLTDDGPEATEPVIRRMIAAHPADAWARRELALCLADQRRFDAAFAELETARALEPDSGPYHAVSGQVCAAAGRTDEAKAAFRAALAIAVDNEFAITRLVEACDTLAERREALAFVGEELVRQVTTGDGLLAYQRFAPHALEPEEALAFLRRALDERPDLWHAWAATVRQLVEMGRHDEALELAHQAAAQFPMLPRIWLDLAAVHQARGDPGAEAEAIRHALQLSPGWGLAVRRLAEVYERDKRFADSRALLEAAVARAPLDPLNHGWLADALWNLGERAAALERVRRAVQLDPGYEWAWDSLRSWSEAEGRPELAEQVVRDLAARRPGEARSWLMVARTLSGPDALAERLAALDRALELNPRLIEAHDLKTELLAGDRRFDAAVAACEAPVWSGRVPMALQGRAAWVLARRGARDAAIARMRPLLDEDPDYSWGWKQLAEWLSESDEPPSAYLAAAEGLLHCAPRSPVSWAYRGEAKLRTGDRAGGKDDLRRAVELAPDYPFAGLTLFDAYLEDDELDAAAERLAALEADLGGPFVAARAVQLACRRGDEAAALDALDALCRAPDSEGWPLDAAAAALARRPAWSRAVRRRLDQALARPDALPHVAALWVRQQTAQGRWWGCLRRLHALVPRGKVGRRALESYCQMIGRTGAVRDGTRRLALRYFLRRFGPVVRGDTALWGAALYALATRGNERLAARLGSDWPGRGDARPWMLINLVLALRALGRDDEAGPVGRRALELPPDYTARYHALWLALDAALDHDARTAEAHLADLGDASTMDATHRFVLALVRAVLAVGQGGRPAFRQARLDLAAAARSCAPLDEDRPAVRRAYSRAVVRLAADAGGPVAVLWRLRRRADPLLPRPS